MSVQITINGDTATEALTELGGLAAGLLPKTEPATAVHVPLPPAVKQTPTRGKKAAATVEPDPEHSKVVEPEAPEAEAAAPEGEAVTEVLDLSAGEAPTTQTNEAEDYTSDEIKAVSRDVSAKLGAAKLQALWQEVDGAMKLSQFDTPAKRVSVMTKMKDALALVSE